ncbi:uncharacterized protein BDZ99DRAFT_514084 [Mytilinidion resinicola]|uniref:Uncharacterized protein n=1 Tax=Mytilinidion resinicola TaxID=574789 RepID=A0A6A6ZAK5_9PEZI|nr:uncharacterized protein BDZ99DRAFT_514084 [Mytilinidion resinicola]KAF2817868.1 hypothetical protein BDZ99DRAFT_514084 [Mytilinidion resinicola]
MASKVSPKENRMFSKGISATTPSAAANVTSMLDAEIKDRQDTDPKETLGDVDMEDASYVEGRSGNGSWMHPLVRKHSSLKDSGNDDDKVEPRKQPSGSEALKPAKPTELLNLPLEMIRKITEYAVGAGGDITFRAYGYHDTFAPQHSFGDEYISSYKSLRLVNKYLSPVADESFFQYSSLQVAQIQTLDMALDRGLRQFDSNIRHVVLADLRLQHRKVMENLISLPNLRRLSFHGCRWVARDTDYAQVCTNRQHAIFTVYIPLFIELRRKFGKSGIRIDFDADGNGYFTAHEEAVRQAHLQGKSNVLPLAAMAIKDKTEELRKAFFETLIAKDKEIMEAELAPLLAEVESLNDLITALKVLVADEHENVDEEIARLQGKADGINERIAPLKAYMEQGETRY